MRYEDAPEVAIVHLFIQLSRCAVKKAFVVLAISVVALLPAPLRSASADSLASSCTASVTGNAGVLNGTYPCTLKVVYNPATHVMEFTLALNTPGSGSEMQMTALVDAPQVVPQAGTFTLGEGNTTGSTSLREVAGPAKLLWAALKSKTSTLTGQSSLVLKDLGPMTTGQSSTQGQQIYLKPQGTLSATMQPEDTTGATGTVVLQITFPSVLDE